MTLNAEEIKQIENTPSIWDMPILLRKKIIHNNVPPECVLAGTSAIKNWLKESSQASE